MLVLLTLVAGWELWKGLAFFASGRKSDEVFDRKGALLHVATGVLCLLVAASDVYPQLPIPGQLILLIIGVVWFSLLGVSLAWTGAAFFIANKKSLEVYIVESYPQAVVALLFGSFFLSMAWKGAWSLLPEVS